MRLHKHFILKDICNVIGVAKSLKQVKNLTPLPCFPFSFATLKPHTFTFYYFQIFAPGSMITTLLASTLSGVAVVCFMTPFDVVSTRLYNQPVDPVTHRGMLYGNVFDCFRKIWLSEGLWGFYKGWGASLFRLGPHTVLSLSFWSLTRKYYHKLQGGGGQEWESKKRRGRNICSVHVHPLLSRLGMTRVVKCRL